MHIDGLQLKLISVYCFSLWDVCCMLCASTNLPLRRCMSVGTVWLWLLSVAMSRYQIITHTHRFANVFSIITNYVGVVDMLST